MNNMGIVREDTVLAEDGYPRCICGGLRQDHINHDHRAVTQDGTKACVDCKGCHVYNPLHGHSDGWCLHLLEEDFKCR